MVTSSLTPQGLKRKWGSKDVTTAADLDLDAVQCCDDTYETHVQFCCNNIRKFDGLVMPWECRMQGPKDWLSGAFPQMSFYGPMPPMPHVQTDNPVSIRSAIDGCFQQAGLKFAKATDERLWQEKLSWERKCAFKKWSSLILEDIASWEIARQVASSGALSFTKGGLMESLRDCLGTRATATIHSRANPLLKYVRFWKDLGVKCFPISEAMVYDYFKASSTAAPSAFRSLLLSLSFAYHVLGLSGGDVGSKSGRVRGLSDVHFCNRRKLIQRPPLSVQQITYLENTVRDVNRATFDRMAAGYFLLLVFGRLRFSDGMQISEMTLDAIRLEGRDHGFLECKAERTKTSLTLERKIRFLPIAVPLLGFSDPCWVQVWLELRKQQGLECASGMPVLPAPMQNGSWSKVPLSVGAASEWLRALVKAPSEGPSRVATHSCKTSLLSMCSKYGVDASSRRFLGYHSQNKDKSLLIYSRDSMSMPLRRLVEIIEAVRGQTLQPDQTRSGYFVDAARNEAARAIDNDPSDNGSDDTESRSSDSDEERDPGEDEQAADSVMGSWKPETANEGQAYVRHTTSRYIHVTADEGGAHLKCGRPITRSYARLTERPQFLYPACQGCFRL